MFETRIIDVFNSLDKKSQTLTVFAIDQNDDYQEFAKVIDVMSNIEDLRDFFQECADQCEEIRLAGEEVAS